MTASATAVATSASATPNHLRFERVWRLGGVLSVAVTVIAFALAGAQPGILASREALNAYYIGNEFLVLVAVALSGVGIVGLLWFAAAIRAVLVEAGQDGWGAAVTMAASAIAALLFLHAAMVGALAYSIADTGNDALTRALNDLVWAIWVLSAWPRAMLVMASSFGFWRAGLISRRLFAAAAVVVVLGVLGGTTWEADFGALWTPDGIYSAFIWPIVGLAWMLAASRVLAVLPSTHNGF
jgi:hypothetical protein